MKSWGIATNELALIAESIGDPELRAELHRLLADVCRVCRLAQARQRGDDVAKARAAGNAVRQFIGRLEYP